MADSSNNDVYVNGDYSEPMNSQHNFDQAYDMDDPKTVMSSYSRIMHRHTKTQLELATTSARRRSSPANMTTLSPSESQSSSNDSLSSTPDS